MFARTKTMIGSCALGLAAISATASASALIPGPTGAFEQDYLNFILDHHYSGLRATELAAGTAVTGPTVSPGPWPANPASFPATPAKGTDPVVLDIAVRSNAAQESEINIGEGFLRDWYGHIAELNIPASGQQMLQTLEAAEPGDPFNISFLIDFSSHHIGAIARSLECVSEAGHAALREYCGMIVDAQTEDVLAMRRQLSSRYGITIDTPIPGLVPEPPTWLVMITGLGVIGSIGWRRRSLPFGASPQTV